MKSAIVTGANGFIGGAVCRELLKQGIEVTAVVREKSSMKCFSEYGKLNVVEASLDEYLDMEDRLPFGADVFYHFAWEGAYGPVLGDYKQQIKDIEYTCDAITLASKIGCKKFIMAGTINELELLQFFHAESNVPRKACIYGISKLACDFMCKTIAADLGILLNVAIIGSCFGPGDYSRRIHNSVILKLLAGEAPTLVSGETMHDWIYIDDVAKMFVCLGAKSVNMKNYYLGHRTLRRLEDIVKDVRDEISPKVELKFGEIKSSFAIDYSLVDLNAIYEDTGFEIQDDFKANIRNTADWLEEQEG